MNLRVDLNADLGEGAGHDDELFALITSANIATGFHAGDADSMRAAILGATKRGVSVGAHPQDLLKKRTLAARNCRLQLMKFMKRMR